MLDTLSPFGNKVFSKDDFTLIQKFKNMGAEARLLFVRLMMRVGPFFKIDKIEYKEINNMTDALATLINSGYLTSNVTANNWLDFVETLDKAPLSFLHKELVKKENQSMFDTF